MQTPSVGFITLMREVLDWEWADDNTVFACFVKLLIAANYKDKKWHGITIKRGSLIGSIETLCSALRMRKSSLRRCLDVLCECGTITVKTEPNKYHIITIVNYDKYQSPVVRISDNKTDKKADNTADNKTDNKADTTKQYNNSNNKTNKQNSLSSVSTSEEASVDFNSVIDLFNSVCKSLENVSGLTKTRQRNILKANDVLNGDFNSLFRRIESSDFLTGKKGDWNGATFDWIFTPKNLEKILAGNYDNKEEFKNGRHSSFSDEDLEFLKTLGDNY